MPENNAHPAGVDPGQVNRASRLLLVDDDPSLLRALSEMLRIRLPGVVIHTCDSPLVALDLLHQTTFDAIVTDLNMPRMNGLKLLAWIRALNPKTPVLLISGQFDPNLINEYQQAGADMIMGKPLDREQIVSWLQRVLIRPSVQP